MKKKLFFFIVAFIVLVAGGIICCRQKETVPVTYICTPFKHVKIRGRFPAFAPNGKYKWSQNTVIMVYFYDGATPVANRIVRIANEWHQYGNISFRLTPYLYNAMVKVSFAAKGYGSAIGKECVQPEYDTDPSMYLQGMDTLRDPVVFRRIVLHEFGHVLGLEHEFSNPTVAIKWDSTEVYKYYLKYNNWDTAMVDQQIFKRLDPENKDYSEFDSTSIMIYAVAPPLIKGPAIPWPSGLSTTDKKGISIWYPLNYKQTIHN